MKATLACLLLIGGCAHPTLGSVEAVDECARVNARATAAFEAAQMDSLVGRYRVAEVITSLPSNRAPYIWNEGTLTLRRPSAAELAASRVRGIGYRPRQNLRLVGTWSMKGWPRSDAAEVDAGVLYLGCRDCMDGSPDQLRVLGMSRDRVWGTWRDFQTGFAVAIDPITKEPLTEISGRFCAVRESR